MGPLRDTYTSNYSNESGFLPFFCYYFLAAACPPLPFHQNIPCHRPKPPSPPFFSPSLFTLLFLLPTTTTTPTTPHPPPLSLLFGNRSRPPIQRSRSRRLRLRHGGGGGGTRDRNRRGAFQLLESVDGGFRFGEEGRMMVVGLVWGFGVEVGVGVLVVWVGSGCLWGCLVVGFGSWLFRLVVLVLVLVLRKCEPVPGEFESWGGGEGWHWLCCVVLCRGCFFFFSLSSSWS